MKYNVSFKVLASFDTVVEANSRKEAINLARNKYVVASLGDFLFINELEVYTEEE